MIDYHVLADGIVVGRIIKAAAAPCYPLLRGWLPQTRLAVEPSACGTCAEGFL